MPKRTKDCERNGFGGVSAQTVIGGWFAHVTLSDFGFWIADFGLAGVSQTWSVVKRHPDVMPILILLGRSARS